MIWEEDRSAYDPRSGVTHLLGPLPALLLAAIEKRPRSEQQLRRLVERCLGETLDPAGLRGLRSALRQLEVMKLIVPAP